MNGEHAQHGRLSWSRFTKAVLLTCAMLFPGVSTLSARPKVDVVVLLNGDRITGEVKGMEQGKLRFKTDSTGTIDIEWDDIESLTSPGAFEIELEDGSRYFGTLGKGEGRDATIVGAAGTTQVAISRIIRMSPIEEAFWQKFDGSINAGVNYTHSSRLATYSFDATAIYRTRHWKHSTYLDFYITEGKDEEDEIQSTTRGDLMFLTLRLYEERWFSFMLGGAQKNEELGIDLRVLGGGGGGRHIVQTNRTELTFGGGAVFNEEQVADGEPSELSAELLGVTAYRVFIYDTPKVVLNSYLMVFPSVTEWGRYRSELNVTLSYEIFKDFTWNLSAFDSFDNQPPTEDAQINDWGVVMSVGWTY